MDEEKTHYVIKIKDLEQYCTATDFNALDFIFKRIKKGREKDNKSTNNRYYVCNTDEPYADDVYRVILNGETKKNKTKIKPIKHDTHLWEKNSDGTIDDFAFTQGFCNGPVCVVCGESTCKHCDKEWEQRKCSIGYFSCPVCSQVVDESDKFCKQCGVMFDREEEISKKMILYGLNRGLIEIINNDNDNCVSARIGDYWFYFDNTSDENLSISTYLEKYTFEEIADKIYPIINDEPIKGKTEDDCTEWFYYRSFILEGGFNE